MIDLHGYFVHQAWHHFNHEVDLAYYDGRRSVKVVTGQGLIEKEFPVWAMNHPKVRDCTQTHPGCFRVKLTKRT